MNNSLLNTLAGLLLFGFFAAGFSGPANADKREMLGSFRDWDTVLIELNNGEKHCMMISVPKTSQPGNVNHGKVYLTVTHRPRRKVMDQIDFVAGYDLKAGSDATATIGGKSYTMFTEGRDAWNYTQEDDARMVAAMKRGSTLTLRTTSARGTRTTYSFSLTGFTAAYNTISAACR